MQGGGESRIFRRLLDYSEKRRYTRYSGVFGFSAEARWPADGASRHTEPIPLNQTQGMTMRYRLLKDPYATSALVLMASAWLGAWIWGWGPLVFAYFLLLYFIVALGVRLDEITDQMRENGRRLDRFLALEERRYHQSRSANPDNCPSVHSEGMGPNLKDMQSTLTAIEAALGRIQQKVDS